MPEIIASRLKTIKPSATLLINKKASEMKVAGVDILNVSAGEPDFDTPRHIKEAAIKAIRDGLTKYTPVEGIAELKKAVQAKFKRENGLSYELNEICVSTGAKQCLYNAFMVLLNQGEEVIIPAPYWISYYDMASIAGGKPVIVNCPERIGFKITPAMLEEAITVKTKVLVLNSPSNPTGAVYSPQELQELAKILLKHPNIYIISDDIYEHIVFDGKEFCNIAQVEPKLKDRTVTVNGVSKGYAMTGWRLGYAAANSHIINAMSTIQSQCTSNACSISQAAAVEALNGPQDCIDSQLQVFTKRRNATIKLLNNIPNLSCPTPEGAFYIMLNCEKLNGMRTPKGEIIDGDMSLCEYLLEEALVAVVPGSIFAAPNYIRISCATSEQVLESACHRIARACGKLAL